MPRICGPISYKLERVCRISNSARRERSASLPAPYTRSRTVGGAGSDAASYPTKKTAFVRALVMRLIVTRSGTSGRAPGATCSGAQPRIPSCSENMRSTRSLNANVSAWRGSRRHPRAAGMPEACISSSFSSNCSARSSSDSSCGSNTAGDHACGAACFSAGPGTPSISSASSSSSMLS